MCCGNNSKFKQLSLSQSGNCLEISQEQIGFCFSSFLPSFQKYFDRSIFNSYFCFSCHYLNIPKAKTQIKFEKVTLVFRYFRHFCLTSGLVLAKAVTFRTLCTTSQNFICSRSKGKIQLLLACISLCKVCHEADSWYCCSPGQGCRSVCRETSLHPLQQRKNNFSPLVDQH